MGEQPPVLYNNKPHKGFGPPTVLEPTPRWVRVQFGGQIIADSKRALLLIQYGPGRLPTYYFPQSDVRMDALDPVAASEGFMYCRLRAGDQSADNAAWIYENPPPELDALRGYVSFQWDAMDAWFEEDEQIFAHARDPHKRVDVLASSRHVKVVIEGETVADTRRPFLLFETHLPTRYYIPREDVRMDLFEPTGLTTHCPYKGAARYWSVTIKDKTVENVAWSYPDPIPENPKIKDLICFYNERVEIYVDGDRQVRPNTPWSR